jgi:succinate-acetate transporter protein
MVSERNRTPPPRKKETWKKPGNGGNVMKKKSEMMQWADPSPAGLVALAMACFTFFAVYSGRVDASATPLLGIWLLGGFVVQVVVALVELKEGNLLGGNVFLFFSAFFMFVTGTELLFKFWMTQNGIVLDASIDGWAWLVLAIALLTWTPAYLKKSSAVMSICVLTLDVAVPLIAIKDLGLFGTGATLAVVSQVIAYSLLIAGILALYVAMATVLNKTMGRAMVKVPGPLIRTKAAEILPSAEAAE